MRISCEPRQRVHSLANDAFTRFFSLIVTFCIRLFGALMPTGRNRDASPRTRGD
jgi:hypothetical protein